MKVQVLYAFDGQPGSAELTIQAGETLTVVRQDIGEGWWEGTNQRGQTGLFPAAYVEPVESADYWDDEWDEDSDTGHPPLPSIPDHPSSISSHARSKNDDDNISIDRSARGTLRGKPSSKSLTFAKSSSDNYIMGSLHLNVPEGERSVILESEYGTIWNPITEPYVCAISSSKKESKLKGLKSYIAYQLTPSFNNIQVSRRYKHFDWLHERFQVKFSLIPIPPLPDKQIAGRYEEQFIEHRKNQLQCFMDSICRHPVLSRSSVWQHFITCTDGKRWKAGKRNAERDELVGAYFFFSVSAPERALSLYAVEQESENFSRYIHGLDISVKNLSGVVSDQAKKWQNLYKRDYQRVGQAITTFGQAYGMEEQTGYSRTELADTIRDIGNSYNEIGKLYEEQPKLDWEPLGDVLHIYKGVVAAFPEILTTHKAALQKRRDCEKLSAEGKMNSEQLQETNRRTDIVSYSLMAEINHFHAEHASELNRIFKSFLIQQIAFHEKTKAHLESVLKSFN